MTNLTSHAKPSHTKPSPDLPIQDLPAGPCVAAPSQSPTRLAGLDPRYLTSPRLDEPAVTRLALAYRTTTFQACLDEPDSA